MGRLPAQHDAFASLANVIAAWIYFPQQGLPTP
jgi:hypothetical protein